MHGTTITLLNAARKYLGEAGDNPLAGRVYVTSGLGGMSGAQAKAAVIAGAIGVIAEVNPRFMIRIVVTNKTLRRDLAIARRLRIALLKRL